MTYLSGYDRKMIISFFPRFGQIIYRPDPHVVEVVGLLIATAILYPVITTTHRKGGIDRKQNKFDDPNPGQGTTMVIDGNK